MSNKFTTIPRKVLNEHETMTSHIRTGKCPACHALMSYRGEKITHCICCGCPVEWSFED